MLAGEGFDPGEMFKLESVRIPRVVSMVTVLPGSNEAPLENLPETVKTVSAKVAGAAAATKRTARAIPMSQVRCGTKYVRPFAFEECCTARVWLANMWCLRGAVGSNTMPPVKGTTLAKHGVLRIRDLAAYVVGELCNSLVFPAPQVPR